MAAISGSVVNGANMGFPIAAYVLGSTSYALPIILFQQAVYTPVYLFLLHRATDFDDAGGITASLRAITANPTIIASVLGLLLVWIGVKAPEVVITPLQDLANMAIPGMLLAFGISLIGSAPLAKDDGYRSLVAVTSVVKLVVMPAIACGYALAFGLEGHALYAAVVMAALPTAQNVYVAASRYEAGEILARDTVLVTTVGVVTTMTGIAWLMT